MLSNLVRFFLYDELSPNAECTGREVGVDACPPFNGDVRVFPSAIATFYAPSDPSGPRGMHCERIRSVASWRGGSARRDCVYMVKDATQAGFRGLHAARVHLFFSFRYQGHLYSCALVSWYSPVSHDPDPETGLWIVSPDMDHTQRRPLMEVVSLECMVRAAHLIGVSGDELLPHKVGPDNSLDVFKQFYVNKFADHHAHEIAF